MLFLPRCRSFGLIFPNSQWSLGHRHLLGSRLAPLLLRFTMLLDVFSSLLFCSVQFSSVECCGGLCSCCAWRCMVLASFALILDRLDGIFIEIDW